MVIQTGWSKAGGRCDKPEHTGVTGVATVTHMAADTLRFPNCLLLGFSVSEVLVAGEAALSSAGGECRTQGLDCAVSFERELLLPQSVG